MHTMEERNIGRDKPVVQKMKKKTNKKCDVNSQEEDPVFETNKGQKKMRRKIMRKALKLGIYPPVYRHRNGTSDPHGLPLINMRKFCKKNPLVMGDEGAPLFLSFAPVNRKKSCRKNKKTNTEATPSEQLQHESKHNLAENEIIKKNKKKQQNLMRNKKPKRDISEQRRKDGMDERNQERRNGRKKNTLLKKEEKYPSKFLKSKNLAENIEENEPCLKLEMKDKPGLEVKGQLLDRKKKQERSVQQRQRNIRNDKIGHKKDQQRRNKRKERLLLKKGETNPSEIDKLMKKNILDENMEENERCLKTEIKSKPRNQSQKRNMIGNKQHHNRKLSQKRNGEASVYGHLCNQEKNKRRRRRLSLKKGGKLSSDDGKLFTKNGNAENIQEFPSDRMGKQYKNGNVEPDEKKLCAKPDIIHLKKREQRKIKRMIRNGKVLPEIGMPPNERSLMTFGQFMKRKAEQNSMKENAKGSIEAWKLRKLRRKAKRDQLVREIPASITVNSDESLQKKFRAKIPRRKVQKPRFIMFKVKKGQGDKAEQLPLTPKENRPVNITESQSEKNTIQVETPKISTSGNDEKGTSNGGKKLRKKDCHSDRQKRKVRRAKIMALGNKSMKKCNKKRKNLESAGKHVDQYNMLQ